MLSPVLVTAPSELPVTLAEAKAHCRVDSADQDDLINGLISAAAYHLDGYTGILGRCLNLQTWRQDYCGFPLGDTLRLSMRPVSAVVVTYYDENDVQQTFAASSYQLVTGSGGPLIVLRDGFSWPYTYSRIDAVSVSMTCGADNAAAIPTPIKQAILLLIGHWYENREAVVVGTGAVTLPMSVQMLLRPYRMITL